MDLRSNRNTNTSGIVKSIQKGVSKNEKQQPFIIRRTRRVYAMPIQAYNYFDTEQQLKVLFLIFR